MGRFNNKFYNYAASFGLFSETSYSVSSDIKNKFGRFAYIISGIKDFFRPKAYKVKVTTAEELFEGEFIYGSVTNSISIGGFKVFKKEDVKINDGLFEVILVKKPKRIFKYVIIVLKLMTGNLKDKYIKTMKTSSIHFEFQKGTPWALDGEKTEKTKDVSIIVLKESNKIIIPTEENIKIEDDDLETYNIVYKD